MKKWVCAVIALGMMLGVAAAADTALSAEAKIKVEAKIVELAAWCSDPAIVKAVTDYNTSPSDDAKAMTNDKWKTLSKLDASVKSLANNECALFLKGKKDSTITEIFVSGVDGGKVAFLAKPTSWTHKGKAKHDEPMAGKNWIGTVEIDESTGKEQVQVGLPVKDGGKVIGSIVVGLNVADLK